MGLLSFKLLKLSAGFEFQFGLEFTGERSMTKPMHVEKLAEDGGSGRYVARIDGIEGEAELTFSVRGASLISADHTGAPDSMRGTGAALALVNAMIADARGAGFKIIPTCPYVLAQFKKHPEWNDVLGADL
jgi:predicted GNAT family acetyltransferase